MLTQENHGSGAGDGLLDELERLLLRLHGGLGAELGGHLAVDGQRGLEHHAVDEDGQVGAGGQAGGQQVGQRRRLSRPRRSADVQAPRPEPTRFLKRSSVHIFQGSGFENNNFGFGSSN